MSFFNQHIFFCTNQRAEGEPCCAQHGGLEAFEYTKTKVKGQDWLTITKYGLIKPAA